jgi:hypothetical protein
VTYSLPATFSALNRPRSISFRRPGTVSPPSGKAIFAASSSRSGASPQISSGCTCGEEDEGLATGTRRRKSPLPGRNKSDTPSPSRPSAFRHDAARLLSHLRHAICKSLSSIELFSKCAEKIYAGGALPTRLAPVNPGLKIFGYLVGRTQPDSEGTTRGYDI